jgi:hypothetical protein
MTRRTTLVMALAAGALLAGLAVPAHAAGDPKLVVSRQITFHLTGQTPEARCSVHGDGGLYQIPPDYGYDFEFTGIAYYTDAGPSWRRWTSFRYRLDEPVGGLGHKNNVNIRVLDGGTVRMDMDSPDDRHPGVWYTVTPDRGSVHTQTAGNNDTVEFEAIFDRQFRSDPRCFVYTARF